MKINVPDQFTEEEVLRRLMQSLTADAQVVDRKISDLQRRLRRAGVNSHDPIQHTTPEKVSRITPEGRARIAAAQRARWAKSKGVK